MGYTAAVGTMCIDEIAGLSERTEARFTGVRTDLGKVETELETTRNWSREVQTEVDGLEHLTQQLLASRTAMREEMDQMRRDMDGLLLLNQRMAEAILQLRAGQVHNQGNPIVIDDDSSEDEVAETPRIPEGALLVPIEDEECQGYGYLLTTNTGCP